MIDYKYDVTVESQVTCPYCEAKQDDCWPDGDEIVTCDNCDKKFHTSPHTEWHSTPDCALNGEEHQLEIYDKDPTYGFCSVCGQCERIEENKGE